MGGCTFEVAKTIIDCMNSRVGLAHGEVNGAVYLEDVMECIPCAACKRIKDDCSVSSSKRLMLVPKSHLCLPILCVLTS